MAYDINGFTGPWGTGYLTLLGLVNRGLTMDLTDLTELTLDFDTEI